MVTAATYQSKSVEIGDAELIRAYVERNDGDAFAVLVRRYMGLIRGICSRRLAGDTLLLDDCVQTVLVVFSRKAVSLPHDVNLGPWFHRVATYVCIDALRRSARDVIRREAVRCDQAQYVEAKQDSESDGDPTYGLVDEAINELPECERTVIVGHYIEGRAFEKLAEQMGRKAGYVRVTALRARRKLERILRRKGVTVAGAAFVAILEGLQAEAAEEAKSLVSGHWSVEECSRQVRTAADAVMGEMDRAAAKAMWGWIGAGAAGVATVGVGTALVVSHLQSMPTESSAPPNVLSQTPTIAPSARPKVGPYSLTILKTSNANFFPISVNAAGTVSGTLFPFRLLRALSQAAVWNEHGCRLATESAGGQTVAIGTMPSGAIWGNVSTSDRVVANLSPRNTLYPDRCNSLQPRATGWRDGLAVELYNGISSVTDVNSSDVKVGWTVGAGPSVRATQWNAVNECQILATPVGASRTVAMAINESGFVVGAALVDDQGADLDRRLWRPVVWEQGRVRELPMPKNAVSSAAFDVNDSGVVAGYWRAPVSENKGAAIRACVWTAEGAKDIGTLGGDNSAAMAINADGWVVGWSEIPKQDSDGRKTRHGFLWTGEGEPIDLNDRLKDMVEVEVLEAWDMNYAGYIVGIGRNGMKEGAGKVGFLLKPVK